MQHQFILRPVPLPVIFCVLLLFNTQAIASDTIENSGDIIRTLIPSVALGATIYLHDREGRIQFYQSFLTNMVITFALKETIDKQRPNGNYHSFPSGHTSVAFQGASFIHKRYGPKYAVPAYLGASLVGYSRVESDNHFVEDVIAGAAIGVLSSYIFTRPYQGFNITPVAGDGTYGLRISKTW